MAGRFKSTTLLGCPKPYPMDTKITLFVASVLISGLSQSLKAQVKQTYQDEVFRQTTVVIKEDEATDVDVLNQNFDLEDVGMHQQIRITTAHSQTETATAKAPVQDLSASKNEDPLQLKKRITLSPTREQTDPELQQMIQIAPSIQSKGVEQETTTKASVRKHTKSKRSKSTRVKLKKRKRSPKNAFRKCYQF